jgi:histidyl-tRNA synthetase
MSYKPSIPKGTRDFSPEILGKRDHIFKTIRDIYQKYGYLPIETPSMENMETLTGKYGAEGDKLLFRILNSGDFLNGVDKQLLASGEAAGLSPLIAEKGLRYDLTVPFARYVVQHRHEIVFPFRRYQIQPVWRADRPQKGRYREFFQCDADVIGSTALTNEVELIQIMDEVFHTFGVNVDIRLNNRKILYGLAEVCGIADQFFGFTIIIDKLEKIGPEKVTEELAALGITPANIIMISDLLNFRGGNDDKLKALQAILSDTVTGKKGLDEIMAVLAYHDHVGTKNNLLVDITLARGLNYYTGAIFEVTASDLPFGSLCGGGRYDDLTGIFGMPGVSGVGISFGADRIYDVMQELGLFTDVPANAAKVLLINFGGDDELESLKLLKLLRGKGVSSELYPDPVKIKKQMSYADARKIPYVVLAGEEERAKGEVTVKSMATGDQYSVTPDELIRMLQ